MGALQGDQLPEFTARPDSEVLVNVRYPRTGLVLYPQTQTDWLWIVCASGHIKLPLTVESKGTWSVGPNILILGET